MINLYYDPRDKVHYFNALNQVCGGCGDIITDTIIVRVFWSKFGSGVHYFCANCQDKLSMTQSAEFTETYNAMVDADVPFKAVPIVFVKPSLSCVRDMMNCDVAVNNLDGEHTTDKTVYSGRTEPKVPEYLIEAEQEDIDLKLEHKPMNDKELDNFFSSMKSAQVYIDVDEKVKVLK